MLMIQDKAMNTFREKPTDWVEASGFYKFLYRFLQWHFIEMYFSTNSSDVTCR